MSLLFFAISLVILHGRAFIQNAQIDRNEVSLRTNTGLKEITHDGTPKRLPAISPDGKRFAYVVDLGSIDGAQTNDSGTREEIVEVDPEGNVLRRIIPEGYIPSQFDRLDWIDNHRIGALVCGHANCFYWILDAETGKTVKKMEGGFDFVWSHNSRWVARRFVDDTEASKEFDRLMLNDDWVYPSQRELESTSRHGHMIGESMEWSPNDGWLAFTEVEEPDGDNYVVLASPSGVILRESIAGDVSSNVQVEWVDDAHLKVSTVGRVFNLVVTGNELHDVTRTQ